MRYRVVRLDFWDYRHPTGLVFECSVTADRAAKELQRKDHDPLSCYIVVAEEAAAGTLSEAVRRIGG